MTTRDVELLALIVLLQTESDHELVEAYRERIVVELQERGYEL